MLLPEELETEIQTMVREAEHVEEKLIDIIYLLQNHFGCFSDVALGHASRLTGKTTVELEELCTFYDFIYRRPVGRFVIHVCDGVACWMHHENSLFQYLCDKLGVGVGEVTEDGLFTVLPTACLGNCHNAPAMLINGKHYGRLTPKKVDEIIDELRENADNIIQCLCR
ncbi:NADH-quinone oxidoreductase subunit NuoE [Oceanidesulfovibrio marinus]|uniref:NADH-quinone oxidoreductase subunit NuoE n=1 Tax=Oceanidesulfovibrio marinus TaxID=370038 RepID=A0A6P1ZG15_9BACT|nr:NADH-quinone oxidoreductase subunit NuoE [Oceanidesulfovibrio marinus]QJT09541.1 NADH-quinone oxidoreductase subunit NuoE [Oceanidesulfovibrio marinus]TVM33751.1 NADH-quinone oxidoreductase subunit NuoE [Oceanidesulfovibrio marinus]